MTGARTCPRIFVQVYRLDVDLRPGGFTRSTRQSRLVVNPALLQVDLRVTGDGKSFRFLRLATLNIWLHFSLLPYLIEIWPKDNYTNYILLSTSLFTSGPYCTSHRLDRVGTEVTVHESRSVTVQDFVVFFAFAAINRQELLYLSKSRPRNSYWLIISSLHRLLKRRNEKRTKTPTTSCHGMLEPC
jgi:hypothetical protein